MKHKSTEKHSSRPNVILILLDSLRADHLSCYGYNKLTSPNLDEFARGSALFKSAFSASPSTVGSVPSILTGLYPSSHGTGVDGNVLTFSSEIPALPQVLRENGYVTAGFNTNPYMVGKHGYGKGYNSYFDLFPLKGRKRLLDKFRDFFGIAKNNTYVCGKDVNKQVTKWLKGAARPPFFMWIHYMDIHVPYFPREPFFSQFSSDKSKDRIKSFKNQFIQISAKLFRNPDSITTDERQLIIDCYDSEIRYFDHNFKSLLALLRKRRLLEDTIVIVTSDHGEEFWEHGKWGHFMRLYDINTHVPLLIKYPALTSKGASISKQVRSIDIFPTILDLLNIKSRYSLPGISLLPYIKDENSAPEADVFSEGGGVQGVSVNTYVDRLFSVRTNQWKFIKNITRNQNELYDLKNDLMELNNLADKPDVQEIIKELDSKIKKILKLSEKSKQAISSVEVEEQTKERLKALGYL